MKPYKIIKKLHLWLGLTVGAIVSFSGVTGSLYIWQPEISAYLTNKELKAHSPSKTTYNKIIGTVIKLKETHNDSIKKIQLPHRKSEYIMLTFLNNKTYYYHPKNGTNLGSNLKTNSFFKTLLQLHRNLCLKTYGSYIIGISSLLFCFSLLISGFLLWHRSYKKRWRKGFTITWFTSKKRFNYNLHKIAGIYFMIPLLIISFSGAYFTFPKEYKKVFSILPNYKTKSSLSVKTIKIGDFFSLKKQTKKLLPKYKLWSIHFPTKKNEGYRFRFINSLIIEGGLRKTTDIFTDKNLAIRKVSSFENNTFALKTTAQMYPIHIGESLGLLHRILIFISGFIPLSLYITGIRFYLFKKS
ncbi:PepSY-associated TM helix domain-containing protein [Tenacibaculum haliotis]|uniref:PepSY-associated TM helix domain-containing protein n=1 Tax=Tenacibaculum haliotis TaxID=1888914 RepID=UPI0021AF32A7|nr:PepSY-associated TM helix domain-containing protein [Tenacibaculum haliotis]MCT4699856.1 PepSY domain-containing protein [Tenacibaculum haliotis]